MFVKGSIKLAFGLVISISLFLSCSLLFMNAEAQVSLEKVNLGDNLIRIQTDQGYPVVDVELLENTDQCLVDCYAILKIHPYQDITFPQQANTEFDWKFVKARPWMEGLVSHHFEILDTIEYKVEIPEYGKILVNTTCYNEDNTTSYECEIEQTVQTGSHEETRYKEGYVPFAFWGETLKAGQDYTLKLMGKKKAQLGPNNIDWIPTIKGIEIEDWEWWNTSWSNTRPINLWTTSGSTGNDYQMFLNVSSYPGMQSDFDDVRFTLDDNSSELYYWMDDYECHASDYCHFWVNLSSADITTTNITIWMWYNNSAVGNESDGNKTFIFFDNFNRANSNTVGNGWTEVSDTSGTGITINNGKLRMLDDDDDNSQVYGRDLGDLTNIRIWLVANYADYGSGGTIRHGYQMFEEDSTGAKANVQFLPYQSAGQIYYYNIEDQNTGKSLAGTGIDHFFRYNFTSNGVLYMTIDKVNSGNPISVVRTDAYKPAHISDIKFIEVNTADGVDFTIDNVRVGKYIVPEPLYSIGDEIYYDGTPPSFSNYKMKPDSPNEDQNVKLNVTISEAGSSIHTVLLELSSTNYTVKTNISSEFYFTILAGNFTAHDNVTYVWYANNTWGKMNRSDLQSFIVANRPPSSPSLAKPANYSGVALGYPVPEFNWTATDEDDEDTSFNYTFEIYYSNNTLYNQTTTVNNYNTPTLPTGFDQVYHWRVRANDSYNVSEWSVNRTFQYANWTIVFNATDSETGEVIPENTMEISCNNGFTATGKNPYTAIDAFAPGTWACTFSDVSNYYSKEHTINTNNDTSIQIPMSSQLSLTTEEHNWLEWLYTCWNSGTCKDLLESINLTTTETSETVENIWDQVKRTDQSVVTSESITSKTVNSTSNLTIEYSISVPEKEGYTFGDTSGEVRLDYLPIRISYWFLDSSDNETCYSQGNYSIALAEPYCQPLTVYTIGQVNQTISFTVDLRPSLPSGAYTIVRNIEIDPEQIWINYGREAIGVVDVKEGNEEAMIGLQNSGSLFGDSTETHEQTEDAQTTGGFTGWFTASGATMVALISIIVVLGLAGCLAFRKRRN